MAKKKKPGKGAPPPDASADDTQLDTAADVTGSDKTNTGTVPGEETGVLGNTGEPDYDAPDGDDEPADEDECPNDTNGDGDCGQLLCPVCGPKMPKSPLYNPDNAEPIDNEDVPSATDADVPEGKGKYRKEDQTPMFDLTEFTPYPMPDGLLALTTEDGRVRMQMTDTERAESMETLANLYSSMVEHEEAKKTAAAEYAAEIKKLKDRANIISRDVQNRKATHEVRLQVVADFREKKALYVNPETAMVVGERPLTAEEMQMDMFDGATPVPTNAKDVTPDESAVAAAEAVPGVQSAEVIPPADTDGTVTQLPRDGEVFKLPSHCPNCGAQVDFAPFPKVRVPHQRGCPLGDGEPVTRSQWLADTAKWVQDQANKLPANPQAVENRLAGEAQAWVEGRDPSTIDGRNTTP